MTRRHHGDPNGGDDEEDEGEEGDEKDEEERNDQPVIRELESDE